MKFQLLLIGTAAGALMITGCSNKAPAQSAPPAPHVSVARPIDRVVMEWDEYPGRLEAVDQVEVRSQVSGYLQSVHFQDGAEVKKGDLLFVIDPRPYEAEVASAQAQVTGAETRLELARNDAARAERLLKSKAISEEEADQRSKAFKEGEAALNAALSALDAAKLNLEFTRITAPISGRIGRKLLTEGNLVNSGQGQSSLLTTIVSLDPIYCYFDVPEKAVLKYATLLREGTLETTGNNRLPAELQLSNETNFPHKGFIDFTDNRVDRTTGTLRMRAVLENPGQQRVLQPGYFARVRVPGSAEYPALLIPDSAIGTDQSRKFVYTLGESNTVVYTPISLGPSIEGLRAVRTGLVPESRVVVNGLVMLRPGAQVVAEEVPLNTELQAMPANASAARDSQPKS